jgi:chromosome partitioning protein
METENIKNASNMRREDRTFLRAPYTIKATDLRKAMKIASSTMSELLKKVEIGTKSRKGSSYSLEPLVTRTILEMKGFKYPSSAKVISLMMCKGGVGKTTTTLFLGQRLAAYGARVLLIDSDMQGNLTSAFSLDDLDYDFDENDLVLVDLFEDKGRKIEDAIINIAPNLHLLPSSPINARLENVIRNAAKNPSKPMANLIEGLKKHYDYILIDCAPALNITNIASICASDSVIIPVAPDKFSKTGVENTLNEINSLEKDFGIKVEKNIMFTRYDAREFTSLSYLTEIASEYKELLLKSLIRTCADCKNAITKKEDLFSYKNSNAKEDYDSLARELMGLTDLFNKTKNKD